MAAPLACLIGSLYGESYREDGTVILLERVNINVNTGYWQNLYFIIICFGNRMWSQILIDGDNEIVIIQFQHVQCVDTVSHLLCCLEGLTGVALAKQSYLYSTFNQDRNNKSKSAEWKQ